MYTYPSTSPVRSTRLVFIILAGLASSVLPHTAAAQAQTASLRVQVTADEFGQALSNVAVRVSGAGAQLTDGGGGVHFGRIQPGRRMVEVSRLGYRTERVAIDFEPGAEVEMEVALSLQPVALEGINVTVPGQKQVRALAIRGFYERKRTGHGMYLDSNDLAIHRHMPDLSGPLRRLRGFRVLQYPDSSGFQVESSRGVVSILNSCIPQLFLDGLLVDMDLINNISPHHVEAIEAYAGPGATPAEFTSDRGSSPCGTILIWTRMGGRSATR